jgi:hypothetical protein
MATTRGSKKRRKSSTTGNGATSPSPPAKKPKPTKDPKPTLYRPSGDAIVDGILSSISLVDIDQSGVDAAIAATAATASSLTLAEGRDAQLEVAESAATSVHLHTFFATQAKMNYFDKIVLACEAASHILGYKDTIDFALSGVGEKDEKDKPPMLVARVKRKIKMKQTTSSSDDSNGIPDNEFTDFDSTDPEVAELWEAKLPWKVLPRIDRYTYLEETYARQRDSFFSTPYAAKGAATAALILPTLLPPP